MKTLTERREQRAREDALIADIPPDILAAWERAHPKPSQWRIAVQSLAMFVAGVVTNLLWHAVTR